MPHLQQFSNSYQESRKRFLEVVKEIKALKEVHHLPLEGLKGKQNEDLFIDLAVFGNDSNPKTCFVHSSGLHGAEGFAGSAIQQELLKRVDSIIEGRDDLCLIFVHALNPWGWSWNRRVNENNVDLNRNFLVTPKEMDFQKRGTHELYSKLSDNLLNPPYSSIGNWDKLWFNLSALVTVLRHGRGNLREALPVGQHLYPKGIFFGGLSLQNGPRIFLEFMTAFFDKHKDSLKVIKAVDIHTGLGSFAEDTILFKSAPEDEGKVKQIFQHSKIDNLDPNGSSKVAYPLYGDLYYGLSRCIPKKMVFFGCYQEFGVLGPEETLRRLRIENAGYQQLKEKLHEQKGMEHFLRDAFYPDSKAWEENIVKKGSIVFDDLLTAQLPESDFTITPTQESLEFVQSILAKPTKE